MLRADQVEFRWSQRRHVLGEEGEAEVVGGLALPVGGLLLMLHRRPIALHVPLAILVQALAVRAGAAVLAHLDRIIRFVQIILPASAGDLRLDLQNVVRRGDGRGPLMMHLLR